MRSNIIRSIVIAFLMSMVVVFFVKQSAIAHDGPHGDSTSGEHAGTPEDPCVIGQHCTEADDFPSDDSTYCELNDWITEYWTQEDLDHAYSEGDQGAIDHKLCKQDRSYDPEAEVEETGERSQPAQQTSKYAVTNTGA